MKIDPAFRHYPITEKLDERGMDAVYAVKDTSLKPPVLLKSLVAHLLGDGCLKGLLSRRAEVVARHGVALGLTAVFLLGAVALSAQTGPHDQLAKELLTELVGIRSSESYPENTVRLLEGVAQRLRQEGFSDAQITFVPTGETTNLVVRYLGSGQRRPMLMMAHVDVVDADPAAWKAAPFTLTEADGYYYGRGVMDNKTGVVSLVANLIRLKREGYVPDRDLIMLLTGNEETSMAGVQQVTRERKELIDADFAINTDIGGVSLDERLEPIVAGVQMTEKLYQTFDIEATNPGGHSSLPRPDNAIYQLAEALLRIQHHRFPAEINEVVKASMRVRAQASEEEHAELLQAVVQEPADPEAVRKLAALEPYFNASIRTTCVATMLSAGVAENALPRSARATINCRILPGKSAAETLAVLREVVADEEIRISYRPTSGAASAPSPFRADVLDTLAQVTEEFWGPIPVTPSQSTGATDGLWVRNAGIPVYGFSAMAIQMSDIRAHGLDERILVESFYKAVRAWYRMIKSFSS